MFKKILGFVFLAVFSAVYVMMVALPLRFLIGPLFKNVNALAPWQFLIGNIAVLPFSAVAFAFCYWGIPKALLMTGSLKPTTHKRLFILALTVLGFCFFYFVLPKFHWFFDVGSMSGFHIPPIKHY